MTLADVFTVTGDDGARLLATPHGGQILGWTPAGGGPDRLWLSPSADFGPRASIRGGIPVIFPQFAGRGSLPKHGFARDRRWQVVEPVEPNPPEARVVAQLGDDPMTRALWPHRFTLTLVTLATGSRLHQTLEVRNADLETPLSFTAALHAYLSVTDAGTTTLGGLGGLTAENNADAGAELTLSAEPLVALGPRDVAVRDAPGAVVVDDPAQLPLTLTRDGFDDVVVWNPGPDHGLADVPAGAARHFVCVEPAALRSVTLAAGEVWRAHAIWDAADR